MDIMFICSSYGRKLSTKDHHETVKDNSRIDLVGSGYALALNPCASASEFVYDDQGKLTEVSFVDGTRIIYIHDANGNRIKKIFDSGTGEFFTISAAAGPGGKIRPSWATVGAGGSQTFTISPSAGCHIEDVRVDGTSIGPVSSYTFSYVSSDHTLEAIFAIDTFTIATSVDNGIGGTINPSSPAVGYGANQSFSIVASPNFTLVDVLADGVSQGPVTSYAFTSVTADHTLSARFFYSGPPVKNAGTGALYETLQQAYDAAQNGETLLCDERPLSGSFNASRDISVTIDGGYTGGFLSNPGVTTFTGAPVIGSGTVTWMNFIISN
ncbi:MAG: hypothetical protein AAGU32_11150 [Bacillota bacterium]